MIKILFICHGNICHSPMAEFVMKDLVNNAGLEAPFHIESAATSTEEIGNPVYPPARRKLAEHGINCAGKTARQLKNSDYDEYDLLIGMDQANLRNMYRICDGDFAGKMHLLMDYTDHPRGGPHASPAKRIAWGEEEQGSVWSFHHRRKRRKADFAPTKLPIRGIRMISRPLGRMCWRAAPVCWSALNQREKYAD